MPTGQIEDTSDYQQYPDGEPVEHNGAAYFLKSLTEMGYDLEFKQVKGYWYVDRDGTTSFKWNYEESGTGHKLIANNGTKVLYTEKAAVSREKAMTNVLAILCNSYLLDSDENWQGVQQLITN